MKPYIRTVRELSPAEWLPILRTDLAINEERLRQGKRDGDRMPGIAAYCDELWTRIQELEAQMEGVK